MKIERRNEESSVVFSLASLRALADEDGRRSQRSAGALPSFGGSELAGVGTLVAPPQPPTVMMPVARPVLAPAPSSTPLVLMLGILLLTTIALAAYVVVDPRPQVVITHVIPAEPEQAMSHSAVPSEAHTELAVVAPPAALAVPEAAGPAPAETPRTNVRRERTREPRVGERRTTPPAQPKVEQPTRRDVPLECVLDPNLAGCGAKKSDVQPKTPDKTPAVDPSLPETLVSSAIRDGITPVKAAAKQCGSKHGASAGEKVRVKLSIVGASGAVSSTAAEDPHRGTALGNCVAAALKKASFAKFRKSVIGVEYTITM